jgi:hypothetical protein
MNIHHSGGSGLGDEDFFPYKSSSRDFDKNKKVFISLVVNDDTF